MSIEIVLEGKLDDVNDLDGYRDFIQEQANAWHLKMRAYADGAIIEVCPLGRIHLSYEDRYVSISAQTHMVGPGYHAFVCDFFQAIVQASVIPLTLHDPTQYAIKHDFDDLCENIFGRWVDALSDYIEEQASMHQSLSILWEDRRYIPTEKEGYIVTPMGYISLTEFLNAEMASLTERLFIWNHKEKDALFYRNAALHLLWTDCYFEYSNMNEITRDRADEIIGYLEIAHQLEPQLPLPIREYTMLCEICDHASQIQNGVEMHQDDDIGYRNNNVQVPIDNFLLTVDGCFEPTVEGSSLCYLVGPYHHEAEPWRWMYQIHINDSYDINEADAKEESIIHDLSHDDMTIIAQIITKADHTLIRCNAKHENDQMMIEVIVMESSDIANILENLRQTAYQNKETEPMQA